MVALAFAVCALLSPLSLAKTLEVPARVAAIHNARPGVQWRITAGHSSNQWSTIAGIRNVERLKIQPYPGCDTAIRAQLHVPPNSCAYTFSNAQLPVMKNKPKQTTPLGSTRQTKARTRHDFGTKSWLRFRVVGWLQKQNYISQ